MDILILVGGRGSRLQSIINDRPKPMALFQKKPFLDLLIDFICKQGGNRIILCAGHKGSFIKDYYQKHTEYAREIICSYEDIPLGTAGAIKYAEPFIKTDPFLVMNGDSFCPFDLNRLTSFHSENASFLTILLASLDMRTDCGNVIINQHGIVTHFAEKQTTQLPEETTWMNGGVYVFQKEILDYIPYNKPYSIELQLVPSLILKKPCYGFTTTGKVIDIGTPERFTLAQQMLSEGLLPK
ncbi:MAG: Nucleotidyl transferase [Chlamydiales bacterium]|jgi:NDP-sugar pyrophosphorylase family protein|nr:Nucleotidyl transferase [Chlamydiales bacterium]